MNKRNKKHFYLKLKQIACFSVLSGCLIQLTQGQSHNKQQVGMAPMGRVENNIIAGVTASFRIENGQVWGWGADVGSGIVGAGSYFSTTNIPLQVKGINGSGFLTNVVQVSTGNDHTLALLSNGRVVAWGLNGKGGLGVGAFINKTNVPMQVLGPGGLGLLQNIVAVAAGHNLSLALKSDGTVWAWGRNEQGQLGNGQTNDNYFPVKVLGLSNVCAISTDNGNAAMALKSDGTVWCWGDGWLGTLGTGFFPDFVTTPVQAVNLNNIIKISSKWNHCLALKDDGTVWVWGNGAFDYVKGITANTTNSALPSQVIIAPSKPLTNIVDIAAGGLKISLCLAGDGKVWGCGYNSYGALANNETNFQTVSLAENLNNKGSIVAISVGHSHGFALTADGKIYGWGKNNEGELGLGTYFESTNQPQQTYQYTNGILNTAAGAGHGLALKANGRVYSWGNGVRGELGNGQTGINVATNKPVSVLRSGFLQAIGMDQVASLAAGGSHSLAIRGDGSVWAWGGNFYGELGSFPVISAQPLAKKANNLQNIAAIDAGGGFSMALDSEGSVWSWGDNHRGQLGNGFSGSGANPLPTQVKGENGKATLKNIKAIACGKRGHALALKSDGTVYSWGDNMNGELGRKAGGLIDPIPAQVRGEGGVGFLSNIIALACGDYHSLALRTDGSVLVWGDGTLGQLANGVIGNNGVIYTNVDYTLSSFTNVETFVPISVKKQTFLGPLPLDNIVAIACGSFHSLALAADGTLYGWGLNDVGQLGNGALDQVVPLANIIGNVKGVTALACGTQYSLIRTDKWQLRSTGKNTRGQQGDGSPYNITKTSYGNSLVFP